MFGRSLPLTLLSGVSLVLVVACGGATGGAAPAATVYSNPTSGSLPSASSIDQLTRTVAPECDWRELPASSVGTSSGDVDRFCDSEYLLASIPSGKDVQTVEDIRSSLGDDTSGGWMCTWWGFVEMIYSYMRNNGAAPSSVRGSPAPDKPVAVVMGGNWMVLAPTQESAQRIASATKGYLLTAPHNCPSQRSLECSQRSVDDFQRLTKELPWAVVGRTPSPDAWLVFKGVEQTDGSRTRDTCGSYGIVVDADQATVLAGLPAVLRQIGFAHSIETGGSNGGTAQTFIQGDDAAGRTLNIAVYPENGGSQTSFSAYVTDP